MTVGHAQQFCAPVVAPTGTTATGTKLLPEAKATVGEPHLLVDRRLDWHRAHHEAGHITVAWLLAMNASGATINGQGATFFGEERISDPGKTLDLAAALARLMPPLGASRDDVAVDLLRCVDITICSMAGIEAEPSVLRKRAPQHA
jgi:hypothetical protein